MRDQDELRQLTDRDGIALPDALAEHGVDLDRATEARSAARERGRLPRAAHRAGPGARVHGPRRSAPCSAPSASSATGSPGRARRPTPARRRWTAPRRARRRGEARARHPADRGRDRRRRGLHERAASSAGRGSSPRSSRRPSSCSTSATSTPASSPRCSPRRRRRAERFAAEEPIEVAWERIWSIEPILFDEPLIEPRRRGDHGGRRHVAPPAERARCTTPPRSRARASRR